MSDIDLFGSVFNHGDVIFEQGSSGNNMFIVQSGAIEISCLRGEEKVVIVLLEQGEFFGEMALIDSQSRSATATALCRTRLLTIHRDSFFSHTKYDTTVILQLIKSLCKRIERTNELLRFLIMSDDYLRSTLTSSETLPSPDAPKPEDGLTRTAFLEGTPPPDTEVFHPRLSANFPWDSDQSVVSYCRGKIIFKEGDDGKEMYIVVKGNVDIYTETAGREILLNRLEAGDFFGEMALVTGNARTATAVATSDTQLMAINSAQLKKSLSANPELAFFIVKVLISRLRFSTTALESPERSVEFARHILSPVFKKAKKIRIALVSLSTCGGCTAAMIQIHSDLSVLTETADIVYCPMLMDADTISNVDVALVDGAVRTREDEQLLLEIRRKSRFVAAWGTCAAFGGIPAMANQYELEELLEETYGQAIDPFSYYLSTGKKMGNHVTETQANDLLRKARKLDDVVRIDYFLPGCPPRASLAKGLIEELRGDEITGTIKPIVCAECPRKPKKLAPTDMWIFPNHAVNNEICLVSQGVLCLGLITKGGCGAACLQGGLPCWGCRGPMQKAIEKINSGSIYEDLVIDTLAHRSKLGVDKLRAVIRLLRLKGGSSLNFDTDFVKDTSRLR
jgi:F420-non-reducing hydrogenase small subunit